MPKQWAWHICLLYMLCDDWASEGHENLYLISRLGSEMDDQRAHLLWQDVSSGHSIHEDVRLRTMWESVNADILPFLIAHLFLI